MTIKLTEIENIKNLPLTMAISNAGLNAKSQVRLSIPPKLRFDVFGKRKGKTQSVALAIVRSKLKVFGFEIPHYS